MKSRATTAVGNARKTAQEAQEGTPRSEWLPSYYPARIARNSAFEGVA